MPLENGEVLSRCIQQVVKACSDVQTSVKELGAGRDAIARDRLRRTRLLVQQCNSRVEEVLSDAEPSLESLRQQYAKQKAVFERINAEATRRERQTFRQTDPASIREGDLDALESQVTFCEARPLNMSEFHTEEAIQREKLQSAREVESDVMDLKMTYQEFHSLVHQQQESLDRVTNNVTESRSLIERGHDQIQDATRRQRSYRKIGCISGTVVIVIMVIVIIVVMRHYHHAATSSALDSGYPGLSGITAGSPDLPPGNLGSPFPEQMSNPYSSDEMQGSDAPQAPLTMHADVGQHSKPHSPPLTSEAEVLSTAGQPPSADVKAPWDDDDWDTPGAPVQHPASVGAPANPPPPPENHAAPPVSIVEQTNPGSPAEPHPTPVAMSPSPMDGFIASSSPGGSPKSPSTPPEKPSAAHVAKTDALKKQIANRTAAMDAETKEKETKIMTAAQAYLKALITKREEEVRNAKASHKEEQQVGAEKINEYKKSGALWSAVGLLVDLQKPNQYSRSTEQMRTVLSTLNATPAKK